MLHCVFVCLCVCACVRACVCVCVWQQYCCTTIRHVADVLTCLRLPSFPLPIQYTTGSDYGELYDYYDGETAKENEEYSETQVNSRAKMALSQRVCHVVSCCTSSWVSVSPSLLSSFVFINKLVLSCLLRM